MKRFIRISYFFCIALQICLLGGTPFFALAADPVVGARLLTPADRREGYVAYMKTQSPQANVTFNNQAARTGDQLIAQVAVSGFKDNPEDLYYTWYLKRSGCELDSGNGDCDWDKDGKVTVNDWKIEAARISAKNGFDGEKDADYAGSGDSDKDGFEVEPSVEDWEMPYRSKNEVDIADCYIQDFEKGRFYELRQTTPVFNCSNGGSMACGKNTEITCSDGAKNICGQTNDYECKVEKDEEVENFEASVQCPQADGLSASQQKTPVCGEPEKTLFDVDNISSSRTTAICAALGDDANNGGVCSGSMVLNSDGSRLGSTPSCTFKKSNNLCKHLFPTQVAPKNLDNNSIKTGDGRFSVEEEKFWGTDPANKSTSQNGLPDEANIVGLGAKSFTWTYRSGDQIGVAVEGIGAVATKHDDNSYMRTWAFSKNVCKELSDNIRKLRAFYIEYQKVPEVNAGFLTTVFDLNDCLEENLIDPTSGGIGNLQVNVLASPTRATNDPLKTGRGDTIRAQATVSGTNDVSALYYEWTVEASSDATRAPIDDKWIDITDKISEHTTLKGFGINEMKFLLDLPRDSFKKPEKLVQYIRVKAKVSENSSDQNRVGRGTFIVQIDQIDKDITPYLVTATSEGKVTLDKSAPICQEGNELAVCPVTENRIIGLTVPNEDKKLANFSWKLNKTPLSCSQDSSPDCSGDDSGVVFFPATGSVGEIFEVTVNAKDTETGMAKTMARKFQIVQPSMNIVSSNEELVWPKQLGVYKDIDGNETPDYSKILLQTNTGNTVALKAEFSPAWVGNYSNYTWMVNDEYQTENEDLEFQAEQSVGSTYNISAKATYLMASGEEQILNTRKALANIWGVSPQTSIENELESNIQVEVVEGTEDVVKAQGTGGIFASLASNLPGEMMFLLRLALTVGMLILVTGVVFAVTPEFGEKKK